MSINNEEIIVRPATNQDCQNVKDLVFGVLREYGLDPAPEGIDRDLDDLQASYIDRGGIFEILEDEDGKLLGTVGLYPLDESHIELRKMYFSKEIRGQGLGNKTLQRMIDLARKKGFRQISLETASVLKEAIGLYKKFGFIEKQDEHAPRCDQAFYLEL
jgi:putative acetyltransferase